MCVFNKVIRMCSVDHTLSCPLLLPSSANWDSE